MKNFNAYSRYYDLLYKDKEYQQESQYVANQLKTHFPKAKTILELGSGSGSHANYLCKDGFSVFGIERSSEMVEEAKKKKIENFEVSLGDICDYNLNKKFDAAISLFHVISYLSDNKSLISCFKATNQHLVDGGVFLFDVWYTPAVYSLKPETRIKRLEDNELNIIRIAQSDIDFQRNIVNVNYEVMITNKSDNKTTVLNEKHPMRHFSIPEIELLAQITGFEVLKAEEFLSGNTPDDKTWGVCFILKKKSHA